MILKESITEGNEEPYLEQGNQRKYLDLSNGTNKPSFRMDSTY